jgi:hypothetical protein
MSAQYLFLNIADFTIALLCDDPELRVAVEGATEKFLVTEADPDVRIQASWGDLSERRGGEKIFDSGLLWQLYIEGLSYRFHFTSPALGPVPYKVASFDREFNQGEVCLHHPYFPLSPPLYPLDYPLDELLLVNLLARGRGVDVHACGAVDRKGNGHLFVGQSGAGKTTMARLWQNRSGIILFSDDRIILRQWGTALWMYGTPWHGEAELTSPGRAPITRIYFLSKGIKNELVPLRKSDAASRLFACSFPPFYSREGLDFTLSFLKEVVENIPCYELRFSPDERAVEFVLSSSSSLKTN